MERANNNGLAMPDKANTQQEKKEALRKNAVLLYRENYNYDKLVPQAIQDLQAMGYQIKSKTVPQTTTETEAQEFAERTLAEIKKGELVFSDNTCKVSPEQISLDDILYKVVSTEGNLPENAGPALVHTLSLVNQMGYHFNKVSINAQHLADHIKGSAQSIWKAGGSARRKLEREGKIVEYPDSVDRSRVENDNKAAEVVARYFRSAGINTTIVPSSVENYKNLDDAVVKRNTELQIAKNDDDVIRIWDSHAIGFDVENPRALYYNDPRLLGFVEEEKGMSYEDRDSMMNKSFTDLLRAAIDENSK